MEWIKTISSPNVVKWENIDNIHQKIILKLLSDNRWRVTTHGDVLYRYYYDLKEKAMIYIESYIKSMEMKEKENLEKITIDLQELYRKRREKKRMDQ